MNLNLRRKLPRNVLTVASFPSLCAVCHLPRPNFSWSLQFLSCGEKLLNVGSTNETCRFVRLKKPSFFVCMVGYPLTAWLFALAAAHCASLFENPFIAKSLGVDEPNWSSVKPREVHPPVGNGEGLLDMDIGVVTWLSLVFVVAGTFGRDWSLPVWFKSAEDDPEPFRLCWYCECDPLSSDIKMLWPDCRRRGRSSPTIFCDASVQLRDQDTC